MKKAVKGLIIAASVAAVVGVGAVSYAKWSAGDAQSAIVSGSTGSINTIGDLTVTPISASGSVNTEGETPVYTMKELYPVDQGTSNSTAVPSTGVIYWGFEVTVDGEGDQTIKLAGEITKNSTAVEGATLYWTKTTPTSSTTAADGTALSDTAVTLDITEDDTVYVYMVTDAAGAMNATISLTFSAEAA